MIVLFFGFVVVAVVLCQCFQCSWFAVLLAWPSRLLQLRCSGPVHAWRLSVWPRSQAWFAVIGLPHLLQVGVAPPAMALAHRALSCLCALP